jgi:hypothetical protein
MPPDAHRYVASIFLLSFAVPSLAISLRRE